MLNEWKLIALFQYYYHDISQTWLTFSHVVNWLWHCFSKYKGIFINAFLWLVVTSVCCLCFVVVVFVRNEVS